MRSLLAVLLLAVMAAEAQAELPPLHCEHDWWVPNDDVPTLLAEVPSQPRLFLPAQIPWVNDGETSRVLEGLSVEVRDASGAEVAGQLDWAVYDDRLYTLSGVLRWRPVAALALGERHTLTLVVMDAPADWEPYGCARRPGFSRTMVFTTASAPQETPRLDVSLQLVRTWSTGIQHGLCDGWESDASCGNDSGYCCKAHHGAMWTYDLTVRLEGILPPPLYTAVRALTDWPGEWDRLEVIHPAAGLRELSVEYDDPFVEPSSTDELCSVVSVHSLMEIDEVELAKVRVCPVQDDIIYLPNPGPLTECDPSFCGVVEPGPELPADPNPESRDGGCSAGLAGWLTLWTAAVIGGARRRRWARGS